jgi:hypothetical protein
MAQEREAREAPEERDRAGGGRDRRPVRGASWRDDRYIFLFALLIVIYVMVSVVNSMRYGGLLRVVPIGVAALFALHTSGAHRRLLVLAWVTVAVAVVIGIVQAFTGVANVANAVFVVETGLLLVTPVAIFRRVMLTHQRVDIQTVFAALDVYIIIGLFFAQLFQIMGTISWQVAHVKFLAQPHPPPPGSDYVYLSFVTLTTVGFGDITPYTSLARSVVVLEALVGQIFLVTLVARLVAMFGMERSAIRGGRGRSSDPEREEDGGHERAENDDGGPAGGEPEPTTS